MNQYQNICQFFKETQDKASIEQIQERIRKLEAQKQKLILQADMEKIDKIQKSVDQRMGPQMCDNSEHQNKQVKNKFLQILKDYKMKIASKIKIEKNHLDLAKSQTYERIDSLSQKMLSLKKQIDKLNIEKDGVLSRQYQQNEEQDEDSLSDDLQHTQRQVARFENEIEMQLLELQLQERKNNGNFRTILHTLEFQL